MNIAKAYILDQFEFPSPHVVELKTKAHGCENFLLSIWSIYFGQMILLFTPQVKGQGIYAFVTLVDGVSYSEELRKSLILTVRKQVSVIIRTIVLKLMAYSKIFQSIVSVASTVLWSSGNS